MALRNIVKVGDPILRKTSREVTKFDDRLFTLLDDMKETLDKAQGVGLAAVQVGVLKRVVIVDCGDGVLELINPSITYEEGVQEGEEGCLSLPKKWGKTRRPMKVKIKAQNRKGQWCVYAGEELKAKCFCHEIDHLDGILFTDHVLPGELREE